MTTSQMWIGSFGMIDQNQLRETPLKLTIFILCDLDNCLLILLLVDLDEC